ncbi:MAG: NUDIX hydrolase [Steroidobacteraceae bacterium]|jgi:ADP-ribose pyrophosphatase YjhB (NUDIX family)
MKFCPNCGAPVERRVPAGDHLPRAVCGVCALVHYQNPRVVVGCVPEWQGRILLCRRAIEPRRGYWTAPAGYLEIGESLLAAAARETAEEALAEVTVGTMLSVVNVLYAAQVHVMFRATMRSAQHAAGIESLETRLYDEADIPWDQIAFSSMHFALRRYLEDRRQGTAGLHFHDLAERSPY